MSKYLLMLLSLFFGPNYIGACCTASLITNNVVAHPPGNMTFYNAGKCLAVSNDDNTVTVIQFLTPECAFGTNGTFNESNSSIVGSSGKCVAVVALDGYTIYTNSGCALDFASSAPATGVFALGIAFSPSVTCAFGLSSSLFPPISYFLDSYSVSSSCVVSLINTRSLTTGIPVNLAFSPFSCAGDPFFAVLYSNTNVVDLFAFNNSTCAIRFFGTITTAGNGGESIAFSPALCNGKIFLAVDIAGQGVETFTIDPTTCTVTSLGVTNPKVPVNPSDFVYLNSSNYAFTPNGSCLISNDQFRNINTSVQDSVTNIYSINSTTCKMILTDAHDFSFNTSKGLAIHPSGSCMAISFPATFIGPVIAIYSLNISVPTVSISPAIQVICPNKNEPIKFTANASGGTGTLTYSWSGPNGFSEDTGTNPTLTIPNPTILNNGNYTVTVTDSTGCEAISSIAQVVVSSCT